MEAHLAHFPARNIDQPVLVNSQHPARTAGFQQQRRIMLCNANSTKLEDGLLPGCVV
jgi:hypothetical protein